MSIGNNNKQRIMGLDALRTLAITGVTLFHMFPDTVKGGYMGVSLFFVLTGFLLAYTSQKEYQAGKYNVFNYYKKRIIRIYPSLVIMLLTTIGLYSFLAPDVIASVRPEAQSILLGYNNWWQIAQNADYFTRLTNTSPFTHMWFMGIELQYYLVWPALFFIYVLIHSILGKKLGIAFMALLGIGTAAIMPMMYQPMDDVTRLYYGTDTRVYALLLGAALGLNYFGRNKNSLENSAFTIVKYIAVVLIMALTVVVYIVADGQNELVYQGGMLLMTVAFCILLSIIVKLSYSAAVYLENPLFRWISAKSYGIFLWQYPVIYLFHRMEWTEIPAYGLIELAVILLLTVWSDWLADFVVNFEMPRIARKFAVAGCAAFLLLNIPAVVLMGYGCRGMIVSAEYKNNDTDELKKRLAANEEALKNQKVVYQDTLPTQEDKAKAVNLEGIVCVGDSIMLSASGEVKKVLPNCYIDAKVSRYVSDGAEVVYALLGQGQVGNIVVVSLGTNGPICGAERYEEMTVGLITSLGPDREIFWVNTYCPEISWQNINNEYIAKMAAEHKNIHVVDWYSEVSKHKEWLSGDGIHPNDDGTVQYARIIKETIVDVMSKK